MALVGPVRLLSWRSVGRLARTPDKSGRAGMPANWGIGRWGAPKSGKPGAATDGALNSGDPGRSARAARGSGVCGLRAVSSATSKPAGQCGWGSATSGAPGMMSHHLGKAATMAVSRCVTASRLLALPEVLTAKSMRKPAATASAAPQIGIAILNESSCPAGPSSSKTTHAPNRIMTTRISRITTSRAVSTPWAWDDTSSAARRSRSAIRPACWD